MDFPKDNIAEGFLPCQRLIIWKCACVLPVLEAAKGGSSITRKLERGERLPVTFRTTYAGIGRVATGQKILQTAAPDAYSPWS
mgnify:CR=1 FL=1